LGQKTHPYCFRIGFNKGWHSRWFAKGKEYAELIHQDLAIKREVKNRYFHAGISSIEIERVADKMRIIINTARSGIIIGRGGKEIESLRNEIQKMTNKEVYIDIQEILKPELDAQLVAEGIALQLEKRVSYRRAMRKAVDSALRMGAKGVKVMCSGRLGGVEIARSEWYLYGQLPLQTLRADIDYGFAEAFTKYGLIGVKVWIYKGDADKMKFSPSTQKMEEI